MNIYSLLLVNDFQAYLRPIGTSIPCDIPHDLRKVLRVFDNIDMSKHAEVRKVRLDAWHLIPNQHKSNSQENVEDCTLSEVINALYAFRSAMTWKPPFNEMICRLICF